MSSTAQISTVTLLEGDEEELIESCWERKTADIDMKEINDFVNEESEILLKELELADKREEILQSRIKELESRVRELEESNRQKPSLSLPSSKNDTLSFLSPSLDVPESLDIKIEMPRATTPSL